MRTFEVYFAFLLCMLGTVLVTSDDDYKKFYNDLLILHNELREMHDAKELVINSELCGIAKERAEKLMSGKVDIPRDDDIYGMNFFGRSVLHDNMPDAIEVFTDWYNETINYDFNDEPKTENTASFTQIVWKNTEKLGLAMVRDHHYVMVVAIYDPPGNVEGQYATNVTSRKE